MHGRSQEKELGRSSRGHRSRFDVSGILVGVRQFNAGERNRTNLEYQLIEKKDLTEFK